MGEMDRALGDIEKKIDRSLKSADKKARQKTSGPSSELKNDARAVEALDRQRSRALMGQYRNQERERIQGEQRIARAGESLDRQRSRAMMQQYRALERERERSEKATKDFFRRTGGKAVDGVTTTVKRAGATVAAGALGVITTAGTQGVRDSLSADRAARDLVVSGRQPGEKDKFTPKEIQDQAKQISKTNNFDQAEIISGSQAFVTKTGDLETGVKNMRTFAEVAGATGASIDEVASAGADLAQKFDIKSVEDMTQALSNLVLQGKMGAFEFKDMAGNFPALTAAASAFGMKGPKGAMDLGAFAQVARQATGSGEEASTSVQNVFNELGAKADDISAGKFGKKFNIYRDAKDKSKGTKDLSEIIPKLLTATGADPGKLFEIFGIRGMRAVNPFLTKYNNAYNGAKGTKEERQAIAEKASLEDFNQFANAKGSKSDLDADRATRQGGDQAQIEMAWRDLQTQLATALVPAIKQLTPELIKLIPALVQITEKGIALAEWFAANPFTGIGLLIGGQITKDIAAASIGQLIKNLISGAPGGALAGGAGAGLAGAAAMFGVGSAIASNASLKQANGGLGIFDMMGGWLQGKSVDDQLNEQAKAEFKKQQESKAVEDAKKSQEQATNQTAAAAPIAPETVKQAGDALKGLTQAATQATNELKKVSPPKKSPWENN